MACCCELQNTLDVDVTQDALLDVEIGGSAGVLLQAKSVEVTANGTSVVAPDDGFDGLKSVEIKTNVPKRFECGDATFASPKSGATSISIVKQLKTLNASCWDTSEVTTMDNMFRTCSSLKQLDVSGWDTSKVTNMSCMFIGCGYLQQIDVSGWDTSKVTDMSYMFQSCGYLQQIDVSGWDTSKVTNMIRMFFYCYRLQKLDFSRWNIDNVVNTKEMVGGCKELKTLIGDKTLQDVENGTVALRGTKFNISAYDSPLRFSSILALANGFDDLTGATAQTLNISTKSYNNMYNDDDTTPSAEVIAERQARIAAICAEKNWNFVH